VADMPQSLPIIKYLDVEMTREDDRG